MSSKSDTSKRRSSTFCTTTTSGSNGRYSPAIRGTCSARFATSRATKASNRSSRCKRSIAHGTIISSHHVQKKAWRRLPTRRMGIEREQQATRLPRLIEDLHHEKHKSADHDGCGSDRRPRRGHHWRSLALPAGDELRQ